MIEKLVRHYGVLHLERVTTAIDLFLHLCFSNC